MNGVSKIESFRIDANQAALFSRAATPVPGDLENRVLRQAVQQNLVSFPSQIPVFGKQSRPDLQQKIVTLYFVCGWRMDDIAKRYSLGRQRMGQILTAWRIRAVRDGYIQAIETGHPLFKRVRLERASEFAQMPVRESSVVETPQTGPAALTAEVDEQRPGQPNATEPWGSNLAEQLHAIVGILDNQLLLRSRPFSGDVDSCEPLLARAKALCARLEAQVRAAHTNDEGPTAAVILAAKELFQRFQEHALKHSGLRARTA